MNDVWNLSTIYNGFDDPQFEADLQAGKDKIAQYAALTQRLADADPLETLKAGIALEEEISSLAGKLGSLTGVSVKTAYSGVISQNEQKEG